MSYPKIDLIVPVWNNPEKTRDCLSRIAQYTPEARVIIMDDGSERETEALLQEFADLLGERALLLRCNVTGAFVDVVNRGLARAEAPLVGVLKYSSRVNPGWLKPLLETFELQPDAGILVPNLLLEQDEKKTVNKISHGPAQEVSHGSFAALLLRRNLHSQLGGFDERMDGGTWCLKDYSRRAWHAGYRTLGVDGPPVYYAEEVLMGSPARREERRLKSIETYVARWGEDHTYCLCMTRDTDLESVNSILETLLAAARTGSVFAILVPSALYRGIVRNGWHHLHENVTFIRLPKLFAAGAARRFFSRLSEKNPEARMITDIAEMHAP